MGIRVLPGAPFPPLSSTGSRHEAGLGRPSNLLLGLAVLALFLLWSNSFVAISYLLGQENRAGQLDWRSLTLARYAVAAACCLLYCLGFKRRESLRLARRHLGRLLVCALLVVPVYNFSMYYGQQHGVVPPVASLISALVPLFVMVLSAIFLGEKITARRLLGLGVALFGMVLIAAPQRVGLGLNQPVHMALTALAPLGWATFTILSKPLAGRASPVLWAYLSIVVGSLLVVLWFPGSAWSSVASLDGRGWLAVLFLALPCTVLGFAVWVWLLRHLPATVVGFTVFLNPPLTALSKKLLAWRFPATFSFSLDLADWLGGAIALLGMALAIYGRRERPLPVPTRPEQAGGDTG